ncbi:hypothetical protein WG66_012888 [Moniliophthora roreri]|nr:hypothetical protein WG66_012888 [Moniliophthora roreri]
MGGCDRNYEVYISALREIGDQAMLTFTNQDIDRVPPQRLLSIPACYLRNAETCSTMSAFGASSWVLFGLARTAMQTND